jgi:hypothetical protein
MGFARTLFYQGFRLGENFRRSTTGKNFGDWILRLQAMLRQAEKIRRILHSVNPRIPACCETCGFSVEIAPETCMASGSPTKIL